MNQNQEKVPTLNLEILSNNSGFGTLTKLLADLKGQCFGNRGYLTQLFAEFYQRGLQIVTKLRRKMKNALMPMADKLNLRKRASSSRSTTY